MTLYYPTCPGAGCSGRPGRNRAFCDRCWGRLPSEVKLELADAYAADADRQPTAFYDKLGEARRALREGTKSKTQGERT